MKDATVRNKLSEFYRPTRMPGGFYFDHIDTLQRINLYDNQEFRSGPYDDQGFRKFFRSVSKVPIDVARKFIDLDTKNVETMAKGSGNEVEAFILREDLEQWMEKEKIDRLKNKIRDELPRTGSAVIKNYGDREWDLVHIENLRMDTAKETLKDGGWVVEQHVMTGAELEDKDDWDNIKKLKRRADDGEQFIIYECYWRTGEDTWKRVIKGDLFRRYEASSEASINDETSYMPGIVLREEEEVDFPYREVHFKKMRGRWLGVGFIELLFDAQIAVNEAENLERKGLYFTSLHLYWTRDDEVAGSNVLENARNGDIFMADGFNPVANEERNLPAYNNTQNRWEQQVTNMTFTQDVATGANLPSRTRIGVAEQQMGAVSSFFDELKRENFGIFLKDWITEDIIPSFKEDQKERHKLMFAHNSDYIEAIDDMIVEAKVSNKIQEAAEDTGFFPSRQRQEEMRQNVREQIDRQKNRYLEIPDGFYDDIEYKVNISIVGESMDKNAKQATVQQGMQILGSNPSILQNENTRKFFFKLLELGGVSPVEMGLTMQNSPQGQQMGEQEPQRGGSIAAPRQMRQQLQDVTSQL